MREMVVISVQEFLDCMEGLGEFLWNCSWITGVIILILALLASIMSFCLRSAEKDGNEEDDEILGWKYMTKHMKEKFMLIHYDLLGNVVRNLFKDEKVQTTIIEFAQVYSTSRYRSEQAVRILDFAIEKARLNDARIGNGEKEGWLSYFKTHNALEDKEIENILNNKDTIKISDIFEQYKWCFDKKGNGDCYWRAVMSVASMSTDWVTTKEDVQELYEIILDIDSTLKEIER